MSLWFRRGSSREDSWYWSGGPPSLGATQFLAKTMRCELRLSVRESVGVLTIVDDVRVAWCFEMQFHQNVLEVDAIETKLGRQTVRADGSDCGSWKSSCGQDDRPMRGRSVTRGTKHPWRSNQ